MQTQASRVVDYYARLGVPADASPAEIKGAYRNLVKRYHPDVYTFDDLTARRKAEVAMRQINEAYTVLSDSEKRHQYDEQFQASLAEHLDWLTREGHRDTETEFQAEPGSAWSALFHQWFSHQRGVARERPVMGVFRKALLLPMPFCMAMVASLTFWNLGQLTGAGFLGGLTAVLAYPLILGLLLLRLVAPIRHAPLLSLKQRLVGIPIVLALAILAGWVWSVVADHSGTTTTPWDLGWWCVLIGLTCAILASL